MLITDKTQLKQYETPHRLWQGIPSIEVSKKGRLFATFYSGSAGERIGNFSMIVKSDDGGKTWTEPVAVAYLDEHRCYDPCLWRDPLDRLWFIWSIMPNDAVFAAICDDPDAEELFWHEPIKIGGQVMMNKPIVLSTGEWLFPVAVWLRDMRKMYRIPYDESAVPGAYAYKTVDQGKTFEVLGGADVAGRDFDEHVLLELSDDRIANYVRTNYGVGVAYSYDRGKTWTKGEDSGFGGAESRFQLRRLKSGHLLMVNHVDTNKRTNLAALLSEDEGKTWKYRLMLDDRNWVSYPDATQGEDGTIYITYDRERGASSLETTYTKAREILFAKITEEDIMAGELVTEGSVLRHVISKLGRYSGELDNPYEEADRFTDSELADHLLTKFPKQIVDKIFELYGVNCINMKNLENEKLDALITALDVADTDKKQTVQAIISLVRSASTEKTDLPIVDTVKDAVLKHLSDEITTKDLAKELGISLYYMMHQFKKLTGTTITNYKNELKLSKAKRLLIGSDLSMTEIAQTCGFSSSSYFSKLFMQSEKISPTEYRKLLTKN